jgi:hypothetical protein
MSEYADNGGEYCGTIFVPTGGDSSVWIRQYTPLNKGKPIFKKKGRFGIWHTKHRYWSIKWFGADPANIA